MAEGQGTYERLVRSLAPSIFGMDDVKKGVLCQLFGGVSKTVAGGRIRGDINCLLVGDPGVSKSQLLGYVHQVAPRGIYTSGESSAALHGWLDARGSCAATTLRTPCKCLHLGGA